MGVSAGTGFRLDFRYFLIRFDMGFRFKRPDITANDGWQIPDINLKNLFGNDPSRTEDGDTKILILQLALIILFKIPSPLTDSYPLNRRTSEASFYLKAFI
ncbi:MAG: hypothetical protein WKF59_12200 [Chitinophagaceae bacterium]